MAALKFVIPIYIVLFIFYGIKNIKKFLLLTGIVTLPFRTDYTLFGSGQHAGWTGGIILTLSDISFILLFVYLIIARKDMQKAQGKLTVPMIFFILSCILSIINSTAGMLTVFQVFMVAKLFFLCYFVLVNVIETREDLYSVVLFLTISLLFQGSLACLQFVTGYEFDMFSTGTSGGLLAPVAYWGTLRRVFGTLCKNPNPFAAYITPLLLLNTALLLGLKQHRNIRFLGSIVGSLALLFSFSRGGWLGFSFSLLILMLMIVKRQIQPPRLLYYMFFLGLIVIILFFPLIHKRIIADEYRNSAVSRLPLLKLATNMIVDHPFIGVGANTFAGVVNKYTSLDIQDAYLAQVHNQYLLLFAETGILGLCSFLWLLIVMFRSAAQCLGRKTDSLVHYIGVGGILGLAASVAHMTVDMFNSKPLIGSLFILAAIFSAGNRLAEK